MRGALFAVAALCALSAQPGSLAAETIKIGVLYTAGTGPVIIAKEKGYFAAEGLDAELVRFDAGQPVAVAAVSGAIDFGAAGITSALYTLASQGAVRLIAGLTYDSPGFHGSGIVVSNKASAAGLRSFDDLPGHTVGLTQIGSTFQYAMAIVCEKHGIDLHSMRFLPFQSLANVASAVAGGQADVGILVAPLALPLTEKGDAKMLAWVGDETPWQVAAVWTSTRTANERPKTVQGFLRALRKGSHDYHDAFIAGGSAAGPKEGPSAAQIYPILQKYLGQSIPEIKASLGDVDPDNRLDVDDIERQIDWFHEQGMVRGEVDAAAVIDKRYVIAMPSR
jgi:NitT/TauT family transport system substrate-binding protein